VAAPGAEPGVRHKKVRHRWGRRVRARHELGVDVRMSAAVAGVTADQVKLENGNTVPTRTVIWTADIAPSPLISQLGLGTDHGRLVVESGATRALNRVRRSPRFRTLRTLHRETDARRFTVARRVAPMYSFDRNAMRASGGWRGYVLGVRPI
jgi:hypothetical protein